MSAKGYCYDNAVNESFFASLKRESFSEDCCFETKAEARRTIFDYLEVFYNNKRRHSSLGNVAPETFLGFNLLAQGSWEAKV
jgi:putative transposase